MKDHYLHSKSARRLFFHVRGSEQFGFQIWLNTGQDFDGVLLAQGATEKAAVAKAVKLLVEDLAEVLTKHQAETKNVG